MDTSPTPGTRALVVAGGGAAGNAWALGVVAGLADGGIDVTGADLVVGTSSGSTVAAQITGRTRPADLYAAILAEVIPPMTGRPPHTLGPNYMEWSAGIIAESADAADMRRRMGAAALAMDTSDGAGAARWHDTVAARLTNHAWPDQRVLITAVDARTGEPVVFDRYSGVGLVDAVAASTSSGYRPFGAYRIGDGRYINGGYRRNENADLAAGHDHVLVLAPFGGRSRQPAAWGLDLATQVAELTAAGSRVETAFPDAGAGDVFDANALDPSTRRPAAVGGFAQGRGLAGRLTGW